MAEIKLNDLRRYAVQKRTPITYRDGAGRTARVNSKGVAEIPGLRGAPPFNVEELLAAAEEFVLEPEGSKAQRRQLTRQQVADLLAQSAPAAVAHHDKEEG